MFILKLPSLRARYPIAYIWPIVPILHGALHVQKNFSLMLTNCLKWLLLKQYHEQPFIFILQHPIQIRHFVGSPSPWRLLEGWTNWSCLWGRRVYYGNEIKGWKGNQATVIPDKQTILWTLWQYLQWQRHNSNIFL